MRQQRTKRTAKNEPTKHMNRQRCFTCTPPLKRPRCFYQQCRSLTVWNLHNLQLPASCAWFFIGAYFAVQDWPVPAAFGCDSDIQYRKVFLTAGFLVCSPLFCFCCSPLVAHWWSVGYCNQESILGWLNPKWMSDVQIPHILASDRTLSLVKSTISASWVEISKSCWLHPHKKLYKTTGTTQFLSPLSHHPAGATEVS